MERNGLWCYRYPFVSRGSQVRCLLADYRHFITAAGIVFSRAAGGALLLTAGIGDRGGPVVIALLCIEDGDGFQHALAIMPVQGDTHLGQQDKAGKDI